MQIFSSCSLSLFVFLPLSSLPFPSPLLSSFLLSHICDRFDANSRRDAPTNPKIFRVRTDVVWEDLVREKQRSGMMEGEGEIEREKGTGGRGKRGEEEGERVSSRKVDVNVFTTKPQGFWTPQNMRAYMEQFAKHRHLDPLVPDTWLTSFTEFVQTPVTTHSSLVSHLLCKICNSDDPRRNKKELKDYFRVAERYWASSKMDTYKLYNSFSQKLLLTPLSFNKVIRSSSLYLPSPLSSPSFYLSIYLSSSSSSSSYAHLLLAYYKVENRRKFFENYARENDFDPLVPDNWYSQINNKIMSVKV